MTRTAVQQGAGTGTFTYNANADIRGDGYTSKATWTGSIPITMR